MASHDFRLLGGWHITLFGSPWVLAAVALIAVLVGVLLTKLLTAH